MYREYFIHMTTDTQFRVWKTKITFIRYTAGLGSFSVTALRPTTWYWRMATICTQAQKRDRREGGERENTDVKHYQVNIDERWCVGQGRSEQDKHTFDF